MNRWPEWTVSRTSISRRDLAGRMREAYRQIVFCPPLVHSSSPREESRSARPERISPEAI